MNIQGNCKDPLTEVYELLVDSSTISRLMNYLIKNIDDNKVVFLIKDYFKYNNLQYSKRNLNRLKHDLWSLYSIVLSPVLEKEIDFDSRILQEIHIDHKTDVIRCVFSNYLIYGYSTK